MARRTRFLKSGLQTSRLGFGTSRLHYMAPAERQRLLALAVDLGMTHIDTAPAYGDGLAEREVGQFIKGRRKDIVLVTKFGFAADPIFDALPQAASLLRPARAIARRVGFWDMKPIPFTAEGMTASVEKSLRRLGTEAIDVLLLHDPTPDRFPSVEALLRGVSDLKQRGLIRYFGVTGSWTKITALDPALLAAADILQTPESGWSETQQPDITYSALGTGQQSAFEAKQETATVITRLHAALARRPVGTVLVSTKSADNLRMLAKAAEGRQDRL